MKDPGIGRVAVAALHQAIADVLPDRLEFYETWLHPRGLRDGTVGLAQFNAVLSFLRLEGDAYAAVMGRAGEHAAQWTVQDLAAARRRLVRALPGPLRRRSAASLLHDLVLASDPGCRVKTRLSGGAGEIEIRRSVFCMVRDRSPRPLCGFYAAAAAGILSGLDLDGRAVVEACEGTGDPACRIAITVASRKLAAPRSVEPGEPAA